MPAVLLAGGAAGRAAAGDSRGPAGRAGERPRDRRDPSAGGEVAPGSRQAADVSRELERDGRGLPRGGRLDRAIELLVEAYALDEDNGLVLAELTLCYVRAEDYDDARFYLRRAEERADRAPPEIYGVLGRRLLRPAPARRRGARLERVRPARRDRSPTSWRGWPAPATSSRSRGASARCAFEHFAVFADAAVGQELLRLRPKTSRRPTRSRRRCSAGGSPRRSSSSSTRAGPTSRSCPFPTGSRGSTTARSACRWRPKPWRRAPRGRCSRTSSRTR